MPRNDKSGLLPRPPLEVYIEVVNLSPGGCDDVPGSPVVVGELALRTLLGRESPLEEDGRDSLVELFPILLKVGGGYRSSGKEWEESIRIVAGRGGDIGMSGHQGSWLG